MRYPIDENLKLLKIYLDRFTFKNACFIIKKFYF